MDWGPYNVENNETGFYGMVPYNVENNETKDFGWLQPRPCTFVDSFPESLVMINT